MYEIGIIGRVDKQQSDILRTMRPRKRVIELGERGIKHYHRKCSQRRDGLDLCRECRYLVSFIHIVLLPTRSTTLSLCWPIIAVEIARGLWTRLARMLAVHNTIDQANGYIVHDGDSVRPSVCEIWIGGHVNIRKMSLGICGVSQLS